MQNMQKKIFLIDDVINLSVVKDKLVKELSLRDYQIIEKKKNKLSFFEKLIQVSSIYNNNIVNLTKHEMCNILNYQISVIYIQNNLNNSC